MRDRTTAPCGHSIARLDRVASAGTPGTDAYLASYRCPTCGRRFSKRGHSALKGAPALPDVVTLRQMARLTEGPMATHAVLYEGDDVREAVEALGRAPRSEGAVYTLHSDVPRLDYYRKGWGVVDRMGYIVIGERKGPTAGGSA